jgi:hypothetical protein
MYHIQDKNNRYLKITLDNKITFTTNESLADVFPSEREATDFIRKTFKKKTRRNYRAVNCDVGFVSDLSKAYQLVEKEKSADRYAKSIEGFERVIGTYLDPEIERYTQELQKFDGMILDIRHWLRDQSTKLNACQGYQAMKKLQDIERERAACKKELQRVAILRGNIRKACNKAENFEYEEYKYRQIEDVRVFLFGN